MSDTNEVVNYLLEAALEYSRLGLHAFPVKQSEKTPAVRHWNKFAVPYKEKTLARWFSGQHKDNSIGITMTGGNITLDIDACHGGLESWAALLREHPPLPATAYAKTGGGGWHYLFRVWQFPVKSNVCGWFAQGIDVKGDRSFIVVEPSTNKAGNPYHWERHPANGIADAPDWIVAKLREMQTRASVPKYQPPYRPPSHINNSDDVAGRGKPATQAIPTGTRTGDPQALLEEVVAKFPVQVPGTRNDKMFRVLASLVGRGYTDELASDVTTQWWSHFQSQGLILTPIAEAPVLIARSIASMRRPDSKLEIASQGVHLTGLSTIQLTINQLDSMKAVLKHACIENFPPQGEPPSNNGELQPIKKRFHDLPRRLCETTQEFAFVEALVVLATYNRLGQGEILKATNEQIQGIMLTRHPELRINRKTFEDWKRRYVSRPQAIRRAERPASRLELLSEIKQGCHRPGRPGEPSEYCITGLAGLLEALPVTTVG